MSENQYVIPEEGKVSVVLDTDTYNEVDDQFALAHLLMSPERIDLQAVYAAPFFNTRSSGPGEGMEKSYEEILRVFEVLRLPSYPPVFKGSRAYLPDARTPVASEVVDDLISRAEKFGGGQDRLLVVAIGACTNIASALLARPSLAEKIAVVWLGGHAPYWWNTNEFNLKQDLHAARVLLEARAPLFLMPCRPVSSHLLVTVVELEKQLGPFSRLGRYLTDIVAEYEVKHSYGKRIWTKEIWDIAATAWVLNPKWIQSHGEPSPVLKDDLTWEKGEGRPMIEVARWLNRDLIVGDFYARAEKSGK